MGGVGPVTEGLRHCLTEAVPECRTAAVRALTRHCDSVTVRGPLRGARGHPLGRTAAGGLQPGGGPLRGSSARLSLRGTAPRGTAVP